MRSISRDQSQLDATIREVKEEDEESEADEEGPLEVEIPDEHVFADMLEDSTVFIYDDELDAITYPGS
ncbi:MAG: hypothetical protein V4681_03130 [Patescibacteria group bacterium]